MYPTTALAFLGLATVSSLQAATYIAPENKPILFKADQLPLDTDVMKELGQKLTVIAARDNANHSPEQLRATSQLLAIAQRLHPQLEQINMMNQALSDDQLFPKSNETEINQAKEKVWAVVGFLSKPEAGKQANLLSQCIKDALSGIDAKNPLLLNHQTDPKVWDGIVAPLESFNPPPILPPDPEPDKEPEEEPKKGDPSDQPKETEEKEEPTNEEQAPPKPQNNTWKIANAQLFGAGLYQFKDRHGIVRHKPDILRYKVSLNKVSGEDTPRFSITSSPQFEGQDFLKATEDDLRKVLVKRWEKYEKVHVNVQLPNAYSSFNSQSKSAVAPLAIILDASLSNKPIREDLLIHGSMSENGHLYRSPHYWDYIDLMTKRNDKCRILVPADAEGDYRQIIALNQPEYFIKNEIISVRDLADAAKYYSKQDDSSIAEATALFKEIQKVAQTRAIGPLAANPHVRERLAKILSIMPNHLSAKMLMLQGGGSRPTALESKYLAYEMQTILSEMVWIFEAGNLEEHHVQYLNATHDSMTDQLKSVERFVDTRDRQFHYDVEQTTDKLRNLAKAIKASKDNQEKEENYKRKARKYYEEIKAGYHKHLSTIAKLTHSKDKN